MTRLDLCCWEILDAIGQLCPNHFLPHSQNLLNWTPMGSELEDPFNSPCMHAQVLEARVDHARVVGILRKADHLPLIKDYLLAVQKANLAAVNEAVNELLIEEDDFSGLRESITTYDNYDQVR